MGVTTFNLMILLHTIYVQAVSPCAYVSPTALQYLPTPVLELD